MSAHRVVWTESALRDLESILDFVIDQDGVGHAERLHRKLHSAVEKLSATPARCRVVPELRALGLSVYREPLVKPYRVPFRIHGRDVVVLGILDGRRDLEELLLRRLTEA